jgi:hypothetical protein
MDKEERNGNFQIIQEFEDYDNILSTNSMGIYFEYKLKNRLFV